MTRIASMGLQQSMIDSIMQSQGRLASLQDQLATGKKAANYRDLGADAAKTISARAIIDRTAAFQSTGKQLANTLELYDVKYTQMSEMAGKLKSALALRNDQSSTSLQETIEQSFDEFRSVLLSDDAGFPMFAPPQGEGAPFKIDTFSDATQSDDQVFGVPTGRNSALVADGIMMAYGSDARMIGSDLMAAFRALASQPPLSGPLTSAQETAINQAIGSIRQAEIAINTATAQNGDNLRRLESLDTIAERRISTLTDIISSYEDVNIAEVASKISQQKTLLETSYAAFSQLSNLSLVNFLR
jgi:flagellar hook-associated protein 3 FlgL